MKNSQKLVRPGRSRDGSHFIKIKYVGGTLSITGVVGPMANGDARGSCGQTKYVELISYADGWDEKLYRELCAVWDHWHLNDMRPGCEHQRAAEWDKQSIDPSKPLDAYGKHFPGQQQGC
jgi:hypothetical protein